MVPKALMCVEGERRWDPRVTDVCGGEADGATWETGVKASVGRHGKVEDGTLSELVAEHGC